MATIAEYEQLKRFAQQLALALADEAMYLENYCDEGPTENTMNLLSRARTELDLEKQFDEGDSLKPLLIPNA